MTDMDPFDAEIMGAVDATVAACRAEIDRLRARVETQAEIIAVWSPLIDRMADELALERDKVEAWCEATQRHIASRDAALARVGVLEAAATAMLKAMDDPFCGDETVTQAESNLRTAISSPPPHDGEGCLTPYASDGHDKCPPTCAVRARTLPHDGEGAP